MAKKMQITIGVNDGIIQSRSLFIVPYFIASRNKKTMKMTKSAPDAVRLTAYGRFAVVVASFGGKDDISFDYVKSLSSQLPQGEPHNSLLRHDNAIACSLCYTVLPQTFGVLHG